MPGVHKALLSDKSSAALQICRRARHYPAISPNGRSIAFAAGGQLWLVEAQDGKAMTLTSNDFYSTRPAWSPDGKKLTFACKRNGNFDVFGTTLTGDTPRRLTYHCADDLPSAFSADGSPFSFGSSRLDKHGSLG